MPRDASALEAQVRECFGRVAYSHKTHEKAAQLCADHLVRIKWLQIILSALTTAGAVSVLFSKDSREAGIATLILSLMTLGVNAWYKESNPGATAQKHRETAADLWLAREDYLSLLTDLVSKFATDDDVRKRRDLLQAKVSAIYKKSPQTSPRSYAMAQKALKTDEELTFADREIDVMLPSNLRVTSSVNG